MSVLLGKRSRLQDQDIEIPERSDKRIRAKISSPVSDVIQLNSSSKDDNMRRLNLLFPELDRAYLHSVLLSTSFNLEKAIQELTQHSSPDSLKPSPRLYAAQLISQLENVKSPEEAVELCSSAFSSIGHETQQAVSKDITQQNKALNSAVSQINKENSIFKKAILKLHSRCEEFQKYPTDELSKHLQEEKMLNYEMLLKLSQIQTRNSRMEWSQDVF